MTKLYTLKNVNTGEVVKWTLKQILEEINRDRSDDWLAYDETDWQDGLEAFTEYTLID